MEHRTACRKMKHLKKMMTCCAVETSAIQTYVQYKVGAILLNFLPQWRSIDQSNRIQRGIALTWRDQDSVHNLEVLKRKTAFKEDQEAHSSLSKIIQQELEDDVISQVPDSFLKCWNQIFAISKKNGGWRKIIDCQILNSQLQTEYFMLKGITDIQEIIMPNDWATTIDLHQAFHRIREAEELQPYPCFSFYGLSYSCKGMPYGVSKTPRTFIKCLQLIIAETMKRCSSRIFVYVDDILILDQVLTILQHEIQQVMKIYSQSRFRRQSGY
ncbi:MAG: hypothetical protein EZS28_020295 [Streblomastix strix]|uniref:Reverse transcriptase domain-containing protein n=1 Tax=Streblomastix strix TaxID=222440 RepID=A0A5J4VNQ5_9EUKA|nr:MAG: hypothetical protein EZS28_020295 [Streblomastix strix]